MDAAEVSLQIIVLMVTQVQISPWPFTDLHPSVYPHTRKAGNPAHRFKRSEQHADIRTGHVHLHTSVWLDAQPNGGLAMKFVIYSSEVSILHLAAQ